jgi:hypothetical protein
MATLIAAVALVAVACGDPGAAVGGPGDATTTPAPTTPGSDVAPTATEATTTTAATTGEVPSALTRFSHPDFPDALVDVNAIISGGPPPDGIPPIDAPFFVSVAEADEYLLDEEPVVFLDIDGDVRAYPVQILIWHEIVNDTVGGVPLAVTYCPLCNSAVSYRREVRGEVTTFGTSGMLFSSALVMYDRATESLWTHFDGRAVVGVLTGEELTPVGSPLLAWADFKSTYPDALVLDRDRTGHSRQYGTNPYRGYDDPDGYPFLFRGTADDRAQEMQRVVGIAVGEDSLAYSLGGLIDDSGASVAGVTVGGADLVILWSAGQATALESASIAEGRDIGSVGVFVPAVDGETLVLAPEGGRFRDAATSSLWTVTGLAIEGPLAGTQLERVPHLDTFWFAWSTYRPGTVLIEP